MKLINIFRRIGVRKEDEPPANESSSHGFAGYVESVEPTKIGGWCVNTGNRSVSPELELLVEGRHISNFYPTLSRPDVEGHYPGSGLCGFNLHVGSEIANDILNKIGDVAGEKDKIRIDIKAADDQTPLKTLEGISPFLKLDDLRLISEGRYYKSRDPFYVRFERIRAASASVGATLPKEDDVKLIAYYLPQFHPVPENNEWWGEGFTEWTNVAKAEQLFPEHYQPHLPADLGFYDLRLPDVRERQAQLAREYGIHGFCYHYYWFGGRTLIDTPIHAMLTSGKPDFPFCICWANERWSRRWDGSENEVLMAQPHELEIDERFIIDILPYLKDPRYIRVNDAPLLLIYRLSLLPDPPELFRRWRLIAAEHGVPDLHIVMAETFGVTDPYKYGCDAAVGFPPHLVSAGDISDQVFKGDKGKFEGKIYDYREVVSSDIARMTPDYPLYRGVMPSWDNTARQGMRGHVFQYSSPEYYEFWLRTHINGTKRDLPPGQRLVFINAWNEWAEGAHLEPDRKHGRRYLEATQRAISGDASADQALLALELSSNDCARPVLEMALHAVRSEIEALRRANEYMARQYVATHYHNNVNKSIFRRQTDFPFVKIDWSAKLVHCDIDRANQYTGDALDEEILLSRWQSLEVVGWLFVEEWTRPGQLYLIAKTENDVFISLIRNRFDRGDVSRAYPGKVSIPCGFEVTIPLSELPNASYSMHLVITDGDVWEGAHCPFRVRII